MDSNNISHPRPPKGSFRLQPVQPPCIHLTSNPNKTLEEFSRHDITGASPGGGRPQEKRARHKATHGRDKRGAPCSIVRHRAAHIGRPTTSLLARPAPDAQHPAAQQLARITDSACKNQLVVVSVQYGPFNPYIPIRSTTIGKSRVAKDPIAMHTSWRSNSDIECN
ncbi:hypothetical protein F511_39655 [Dorcoceras hygrometricum]|uniref:Uncharacterized protein n=1 Tax=Dorcoceras hygrometricum TaxID=472368 RepID=A0A2Z7DEE9_9LAMI|nr:hypothetical protein F511_39655 [Dorcoceras hygrometricum]